MQHAFATALGLVALLTAPALAADPDAGNWAAVVRAARGETVYFHAWGGEPRINDYITWASRRLEADYGVRLVQVKVEDTANVVSRILAERAAGRASDGGVDLVWINGENFAAMKREHLLLDENWAEELPNWRYVDSSKPVTVDFTVPTEGREAPWGTAQLTFYRDAARVPDPPRSAPALLDWVRQHPGRFTYPQPPDFTGSTFLKQLLIELVDDPSVLQKPADPAVFLKTAAPLFTYLDALNPLLWRSGRAFPHNAAALRTLVADGEVDIGFSFTPTEAASAVERGELPNSVRSFVFEKGTIGNVHFLAIPFNATARAGAMVAVNFLMSPEAQAEKLKPSVWGDFTVLDIDRLPPEKKALFERIDLGAPTLPPQAMGRALPEPHPSWMELVEAAWADRYGAQ